MSSITVRRSHKIKVREYYDTSYLDIGKMERGVLSEEGM